jgi:hypothetical protein
MINQDLLTQALSDFARTLTKGFAISDVGMKYSPTKARAMSLG